ncbi:trk system potassium uptake protein TrkH [Ruminococcus sp. YE71]|uniref:TrkH family potassium uptake protein n=1 Tax=unclassified Ruminococcus TaxID=2608920 RepID=UPI000889F4E8|nr:MULTISPECIES: potassium transporter TrkG [unclassified Ruminococcus]SDA21998.1 trk system potassium uptake protein TrkH [Ruminococcus sp. YE78]SFW37251.1 trk system potassium uptake protein TrkH [Ruminococcus sp. YE71]
MEKVSRIADKFTAFKRKLTFTQYLVWGYLLLILVGALVLMFPVSSRERQFTNYLECCYTATSALSGTGLMLYDVYTHWSLFGQAVILVIIQIGGIGFMSMAIFALSFTSRKIGLKQRVTMRESVSGINSGGIVKMTRFILEGTIIFEGVGTLLLAFHYVPKLGLGLGVFYALFHSISAFCTAGIDLMGRFEPGSSMITVRTDLLVNLTLIILLNIGGIGYLTWDDIRTNKLHFKKYRLQSKIILVITLIFYIVGLLVMLFLEWNNTLRDLDHIGDKVLVSSMLVTSGRDAGFAPLVCAELKPATIMMMLVFMFVGGAPGSTACGIKTTTFTVMVMTIVSVFRKRKSVELFGRRIDEETVRNACCVTTLYLIVVTVSAIFITAIDGLDLTPVVFELVSAISSCGLSMGISSQMSHWSVFIVTLVMFFGRIGGLTFIVSLAGSGVHARSQLPEEKIMVG